MTDHELILMATSSGIKGINPEKLTGQVSAYNYCCDFASGLEKAKTINAKHTSYGLKHLVEKCSGPNGGYVYEGTLILAMIKYEFKWKQNSDYMKVLFNIAEKSIEPNCREMEFAFRNR